MALPSWLDLYREAMRQSWGRTRPNVGLGHHTLQPYRVDSPIPKFARRTLSNVVATDRFASSSWGVLWRSQESQGASAHLLAGKTVLRRVPFLRFAQPKFYDRDRSER